LTNSWLLVIDRSPARCDTPLVAALTESTYFVLAALAREPMHGYGIAKLAGDLSDGRVKLTAGTLYGVLSRLVERGQIVEDRVEVVSGRARRYYRLTPAGRDLLTDETERLRATAKTVRERLNAEPERG
jgi:PadR family transcriptional regulator PadR